MKFNPTDVSHRSALAFDVNRVYTLQDDGTSILDKYHAGGRDLTTAWQDVLATLDHLSPTVTELANLKTAKFRANVVGKGSVTSAILPTGSIDGTGDGFATVVNKGGDPISLQAVNTESAWVFASWTGCSSVQGTTCTVNPTDDTVVSANFKLAANKLIAGVVVKEMQPAEGVTGVRFEGTTATFVSREEATRNYLSSLAAGSFVQTGHVDHPTIKVLEVLSTSTVTSPALGNPNSQLTQTAVRFEDASPTDVYDEASIVASDVPFTMNEVRAIQVGDGVEGSIRTLIPVPDYTTSVINGTTASAAPTWFVTAVGSECRGYADSPLVAQSLTAAWPSDMTGGGTDPWSGGGGAGNIGTGTGVPGYRAYPFNDYSLAICTSFTMVGGLVDHLNAVQQGETDLMSGRDDGAGVLMSEAEPARFDASRYAALPAAGETVTRTGESVWITGIGRAIALGNNLFLADREDRQGGFRLVSMTDIEQVTPQVAIDVARSDCAMQGLPSACALLSTIARHDAGLVNAGIPLLTSPLKVDLSITKKGIALRGSVSLNLNIDIKPSVSASYSFPGVWVEGNASATYSVEPELGLTLGLGREVSSFTVPASVRGKKFNRDAAKNKTKSNKIDNSKTLISVDLGRYIPGVGAAADLSLNLVVGLDLGGNLSIEVVPALKLEGSLGAHMRYEWFCCRSDDRKLTTWFNMPVRQPSMSATLKGELSVEPYAEVNLAAGIRGVVPRAVQAYLRGGVNLTGEVSAGYSYAKEYRTTTTYQDAALAFNQGNFGPFYRSACSAQEIGSNPSSCSCTRKSKYDIKCVARNIVSTSVTSPQICVTSPEISIGLSARLYAGIRVTADNFPGKLKDWLSFINRDVPFLNQESPIWSYPSKDNEGDLSGCRAIN